MKPNLFLKSEFYLDHDALFQTLRESVNWDSRMASRKTASYGVAYNYSGMFYPENPLPSSLQVICGKIDAEIGFLPNNCLMNFYPDGQSKMGFHSDSAMELEPGTGVAILSLGSPRTIVYRNKLDKSLQIPYVLAPGDLLYMDQKVQEDWLHAIPKEPGAGERISLTFRQIQAGI